jgi:uncharacterized membrane protein required for colicin V production
MSLDNLPVNLFDLVFLVVLVAGVLQGRKNGMSVELMSVLKWVAVVLGCALVYAPVGTYLANASPFSLLASFMMVYVAAALVILSLFALFKHSLGGKLIGSDVFGRSEYYLGMASGLVRFSCVLLVVLAMLNARYFSPTEVRAMEKFQNDVYGSNFFPTWHSAQEVVFEKSLTGPIIRQYFGFLLIQPTQAEEKQYHQKEAQFP